MHFFFSNICTKHKLSLQAWFYDPFYKLWIPSVRFHLSFVFLPIFNFAILHYIISKKCFSILSIWLLIHLFISATLNCHERTSWKKIIILVLEMWVNTVRYCIRSVFPSYNEYEVEIVLWSVFLGSQSCIHVKVYFIFLKEKEAKHDTVLIKNYQISFFRLPAFFELFWSSLAWSCLSKGLSIGTLILSMLFWLTVKFSVSWSQLNPHTMFMMKLSSGCVLSYLHRFSFYY